MTKKTISLIHFNDVVCFIRFRMWSSVASSGFPLLTSFSTVTHSPTQLCATTIQTFQRIQILQLQQLQKQLQLLSIMLNHSLKNPLAGPRDSLPRYKTISKRNATKTCINTSLLFCFPAICSILPLKAL